MLTSDICHFIDEFAILLKGLIDQRSQFIELKSEAQFVGLTTAVYALCIPTYHRREAVLIETDPRNGVFLSTLQLRLFELRLLEFFFEVFELGFFAHFKY